MAKVTLQSIADRVGVSRMTVSNAFSRPDQLSAELRERILAAADELGYVGPDPAARALARGRTGSVGLMLNDRISEAFEDPIAAEFFASVADRLADSGFALTLLTPRTSADFVPSRDVAMDGALVYICEPDSVDLAWLDRRGLPQVSIDQNKRGSVTSVNVDDRGGARAAAQHLVDLGHTSIGILTLESIAGPLSQSYPATQRMLGWRDALDPAGIGPRIVTAPYRPAATAYDVAVGLLEAPGRPTAVLCFSDAFAFGVIRAAEKLGLDVPGDLSVVGFDDSPVAEVTRPPLTTVRQDVARKGELAVAALLATMRGQEQPEDVRLPTELVVRASTAAPRAAT
ncbi:LacI family DNA-binding transcriptional regulator [Nocardioides sp. YIM 152315]|uniref:LacI family DNA-binding transcriptional regulator n=1 Tax=Nocardioides sp. YIM 152315 TaxID=3031760 RepID=UPI0023DC0165|nr:LacI family DNA-binding transcriptional regulator [Nocardioides sp. YIM 152315]MDF1604649.1 LacI family DNA-binding transcriptional regulator [Nocardioides sp. YIM 152315]